MTLYDGDTFKHGRRTFRFDIQGDSDHGAPWDEEDGHGPVSDWTSREKLPGELVLSTDRHHKRFYDFAEACKIARRDGWGFLPGRLVTERFAHSGARKFRAYVVPERFADGGNKFECFGPDINAAISAVYSAHRATLTARQYAAGAAMADYDRLRKWCSDQWGYVGVVVTLLDSNGNATDRTESLWGIESDADDYLEEVAHDLASELAA